MKAAKKEDNGFSANISDVLLSTSMPNMKAPPTKLLVKTSNSIIESP